MSTLTFHPHVVSVSEATTRGVSGLVRDAEVGEDIVVERHGKPVAAVISIRHMHALRRLESDLRETALILSRAATDDGRRIDLDDAIAALGFNRSELEAELNAEHDADVDA